MFSGLLGHLFWVAVGAALMFGGWFCALWISKGARAAWAYVGGAFNKTAKLHAHITAVHADVRAIKSKVGADTPVVAPVATAANPVGGVV
jgi:hypothetical protein